jgi:hypothetical protein
MIDHEGSAYLWLMSTFSAIRHHHRPHTLNKLRFKPATLSTIPVINFSYSLVFVRKKQHGMISPSLVACQFTIACGPPVQKRQCVPHPSIPQK